MKELIVVLGYGWRVSFGTCELLSDFKLQEVLGILSLLLVPSKLWFTVYFVHEL
jgi:hypothetical protein